jgi:predicted  nucleic acid-binding Zn ribbon protein
MADFLGAALRDSSVKLEHVISKMNALQKEDARRQEQALCKWQEADHLQCNIAAIEHDLAAAISNRQQNASVHAAKV